MPRTVNMAMYYWTKHKTKLYKLFVFLLGAYYIISFQHSDTLAHDDSKDTVASENILKMVKTFKATRKLLVKKTK